MSRSTIQALMTTLTLGALLALPAGAMAGPLVSSAYENLDASISSAWASGLLTVGEKAEVRSLQSETDNMIRHARRDGRVTRAEEDRIRSHADATVSTFRRYRDNGNTRFTIHVRHNSHPRKVVTHVTHHHHHRHHKHAKKVKVVIR